MGNANSGPKPVIHLGALERVHDCEQDVYADFLADDGVIDATEQKVLDKFKAIKRDILKMDLVRQISQAVENGEIDVTPDSPLVQSLRPTQQRKVREFYRDMGPDDDNKAA